jgi:hypothetical protein
VLLNRLLERPTLPYLARRVKQAQSVQHSARRATLGSPVPVRAPPVCYPPQPVMQARPVRAWHPIAPYSARRMLARPAEQRPQVQQAVVAEGAATGDERR